MAEECDCSCFETVTAVLSPSPSQSAGWASSSFLDEASRKERPSRAIAWACQRTKTTGVGVNAPPPPPAHENCCCNHRDTTQTEISPQSRSFKELDLPTELALSHAELSLKLVQTVFSPVGRVCIVAAAHRSHKRKGRGEKGLWKQLLNQESKVIQIQMDYSHCACSYIYWTSHNFV